jgi:hypothetical protein
MTNKQLLVDNFCKNIIGQFLPVLNAKVMSAKDKQSIHLNGYEIWLTIEKPYGNKEVIQVWLQLFHSRTYVQHIVSDKEKYVLLYDKATQKLIK